MQEMGEKLAESERFQEALLQMKPQKSLWGILGIFLFFFLPEIMTALWQEPMVLWLSNEMMHTQNTLLQWFLSFAKEGIEAGVSWFNIALGVLFLWWSLKD